MRPARAIAVIGTAYVLAGCGASAAQEVQAKLQQFAHAVASRDPVALCRQVLAPSLVARLTAAGLSCETAMRTFVDSVSNPTLSISKVRVHGSRASAVVLSGARGQTASLDSVALTETAHGWRVISLAAPR
jgi:hypothetical protein